MTVLNDAALALIATPALAHLVTINADGSPQVSCVWTAVEDDEIVVAHLSKHRKVRNVEADPRVAISWQAPGRNAIDLDLYLVVYGTARITEGGAPELLQRLAHKYFGDDRRFPPMDDPPPGFITRIRPERVAGVGPWSG